MNENVKILCCYYKENEFVPSDDIYFPIQCGKASTGLNLKMQGDDIGDNISARNQFWSEITGLYWFWKNMKPVDCVGLCSYRRFFNFNHSRFMPMIKILQKSNYVKINDIKIPNIARFLSKYDIVTPKKYWYAYSLYNVNRMNYYIDDFKILQDIIHELYPEYDVAFIELLRKHNFVYGHNMFIMKWSLFDDYCKWVFDILLEAERRIDASNYPIDKIRVFGYMHELLLTLYIFKNNLKNYQSQINWVTDEVSKSQFNSLKYKIACKCSFFFNKPRN